MDQAQKIIADIVARCKYKNVEVSETLAAFTARMIVHKSKRKLILEKEMTSDDMHFLIDRCVHVLLQQHDPALETVRMQLEFDYTYAHLEEMLRQKRDRKEKSVAHLERNIASLVPQKPSDFETLTTLYRNIFTLLMLDADATDKPADRYVEKEVATALESVFPRIGLKTFVTMSPEDKRFQLEELMRIVEGIRLFNKELGKGGAGIPVGVDTIQDQMLTLGRMVKEEVNDANEVCTQYTDVLLHVHHHEPEHPEDSELDPSVETIQRWQVELSNRRQFLSYLQSLEEDIAFSCEKMDAMITTFRNDMSALKNLVGSRTSLPKSQVYPLFEAVSKSWRVLIQEHELLQARSRSLKALMQFKDSFPRSLNGDSEHWRRAKKRGTIPAEELFEQVETFAAEETTASRPGSVHRTSFRIKSSFALSDDEEKGDDDYDEGNPNEEEGATMPIRMPVDSTPEFMQLPLEYQGFCPWTIVERGGLLLPGDPSLGVVQYQNAYHVFVNKRAVQEFMLHPRRYVQGILRLAAKQPSLIYLLRLQDGFPNTDLSSLLKISSRFPSGTPTSAMGAMAAGIHPLLAPPPAQKVDASTSTPTHFVEKNIDYNYEWNEWSLRRRALKIANLRHCKTVSCQTNLSHFRREVDTQVYLPTENTTQTGKERGTNPPRVTTYFAGLRNGPVYTGNEDDDGKEDEESKHSEDRPAIISYTFEL
ncbi:hypothetical protein Poli38472_010127 [Pythium oligandrum]|uniref:Cilia- and flagella-associated protein 206 n=1 Tax=Pythium oligandrum TaxID=41045 RepID=A0A8K1C9C5_PYTOL|nr:hypothetical protein Poli38472_010127 [Pythium oligandrum]|eukprot:TMW58568.1 hypothetical protein Poli38472_010127 [Pythium oligandrum]